jgi:dienelactone hydrolase
MTASKGARLSRLVNAGLAVVALVLVAFGIRHLEGATDGLVIEPVTIGTTPATLFRLRGAAPAPAIVIAHGFAGSRQLMQPFAVTLARNGYVAITYDLLGHGKDPAPLRGDILKVEGATKALVDQLSSIVAFARTAPGSNGHVALLGHSMSSDIVVRAAEALPDIDATIAVSMFSDLITPTAPRDLLVIAGALEPAMLKDEGRKATAMATRRAPQERTTYGDLRDGTARRFSFSAGVEHVGVLYSRDSLREALDWLNAVYQRPHEPGSGFLDVRGPALGCLILGIVLLGRPLATLLPRVAPTPRGAGLAWRSLLPVAVAPAVLTPLILWKAPTGFLPILLGDYLAAHFLVYGVLTAAGLWIARSRGRTSTGASTGAVSTAALALAAGLVAVYGLLVLGGAIDRYVAAFMPIPERLPFIAAILVGTLPYALADEWLVRGPDAPRGAYALTKVLFLVSLAAAVALNPQKLFFLAIIVVVIALFFVIYGLFSGWAYRATHHPFVGGLANALAFAWALGVTFPILGS